MGLLSPACFHAFYGKICWLIHLHSIKGLLHMNQMQMLAKKVQNSSMLQC